MGRSRSFMKNVGSSLQRTYRRRAVKEVHDFLWK